jgi:hypothetical protein
MEISLNLPIEVYVALIAFSGVLISAAISWVISRRKIESEIRGIRLEMQSSYANKLQERRLDVYPLLHTSIIEFVKDIQARTTSFEHLEALYESVSEWDSKNSILLGAHSRYVLYRFERALHNIVKKGEAAFKNRIVSSEQRKKLIRRCFEVDLALKSDLGVFEIEFAEPGKRFASYLEMPEELDRREESDTLD